MEFAHQAPFMSVPDAWDDDWSNTADVHLSSLLNFSNLSQTAQPAESKNLSTKQTKAQKRAAQAEFNRQIWAEAETPQETNYFLESRNVVPLRQEFKAPPMLLSRKGPIVQKAPKSLNAIGDLSIKDKEESSEDEDEAVAQAKALEAAKILAAKEREEKQKKYEERRLELFGPGQQKSGGSSPNLTPPGSRSATPRGRRGRGRGHGRKESQLQNQNQGQDLQQESVQQFKEVYDPGYAPKPAMLRREPQNKDLQPIREPKAPDGSGRGGAGFVQRRSLMLNANAQPFQF